MEEIKEMEMSNEIAELAKALAAAQGMMENAKKSSNNPFFKSKYADLAECWDTCRDPLSKNDLSVVQMPGAMEGDQIQLTTMLLHSSGQWIKSTMTITVAKLDAQGIGSAITYARRYALAAIVGIAQEDDDGNAAANNVAQQGQSTNPKQNVAQQKQVEPPKTYVKNIKGQTCVLAKDNQWYALERMGFKGLEIIANDPKYEKCHEEARRLMDDKKGA